MRGRSIREKCIVVMGMIVVLCLLGSAVQAATVTLDMRDYGDGTYDLYATSSTGDNFGIVYYNIRLINILTADHQSPMGMDMDAAFVNKGFTGAGVDLANLGGGPGELFAYQDTGASTAPGSLIYGIGQTAGTYNVFTSAANRGVPWTADVLLASGTYDQAGPAPEYVLGTEIKNNVEVWISVVNIFTREWTEGPLEPGLAEMAVLVPEPATMVLLALGAGLMVVLKRRR